MPASTVTEYLAVLPADRREALTALGVPNALASPMLDPRDSNAALLISNNDWQDDPAQAAELIATGLAPTNPLDSGKASAGRGLRPRGP